MSGKYTATSYNSLGTWKPVYRISRTSAITYIAKILQPQFMLPNPRTNTSNNQNRRNQHSPQLNMERGQIVGRPSRRRNRRQLQYQKHIPSPAMVFIDLLSGIDATQDHTREEVLSHADESLQDDCDIRDQTQDSMGRDETGMIAFVYFDDDECRDECK